MKIHGIEGLSAEQIKREVQQGAKLVVFEYCVSLLYVTLKRSSGVYFIRPGESAILKGLPFTLLSVVMGWWGIPFGPIYTVGAIVKNFGGGRDVTGPVVAALFPSGPPAQQAVMAPPIPSPWSN